MARLPWFTLLIVLLECFSPLSSSRRKQIGQAIAATVVDQFDFKPIFVQCRCGSLSSLNTLDWFKFFELSVYVTDIYFLMERDWCRDLQSRSGHSRHWRSTFPWLSSELSAFPALLFGCAVLPLILVSDFNCPRMLQPSRVPSRSSLRA